MRIQRLRKGLPFALGRCTVCRSVSLLTFVALIIVGLPALSGAQPTCLPDGDVDQNGSVTAADALLAFQQALSLTQLSACQRSIADVFRQPGDPDGNITASDALCIFQKALSLPSCLDTLPSSNQPPAVDAGADQSVDAGVMVFLSGTASDADGTIASYAWTQTGGMAVSLTGSDAATAVFVAPDVSVEETLTFRLTVTDNTGAQASDEVRVTVRPVMQPTEQASVAEVFRQAISGPIVQTKCVTCHVANGASGHTRLVFVRATDTPDHEALNLQTFQDFLAAVAEEGGGSYVLNKVQGVGHGGRVQVSPGTAEFENMQRFLGLLGEEVAPPAPVTVETLFDTVLMASPRKTLRRAALIFAGRIPTDEEYAAVEGGNESVLRATIRGLMEGPEFHEFLIRASNDRLLTDAPTGGVPIARHNFVDFSREDYRLKAAAHASGAQRDWEKVWAWNNGVLVGATRAPLELIAYVAENDLSYTEILTADYIMANPWAAKAYGASTRFNDPTDPYEFKPSRIVSYYRQGEGFEHEYDPVLGAVRIIDPGPLITDYPHAGILNTTVLLQRYPTTATNRNRARSRWTYYHFLGLDVEKSASRTTDPVALADTNNPTMHNPNCTVCHSILDPVAGAFQNYSDEGFYKIGWGGIDSLDGFYKHPEENIFGDNILEIQAASWSKRQTFSITAWLDQDSRLTLRHLNNNWCDDIIRECGTYGRDFRLDEIAVRDVETGALVHRVAWEVLDERCPGGGQYNEGTGEDDHYQWWGWDCQEIPLDLPGADTYVIEVVVWADRAGDELAELAIGATLYHEGDTWYRDMRTPGFNAAFAPHPDNSLQWLARQIAADERFAEAAVKFWWPAIMGSEVVEFPEVETDADFDGRLLAANAQRAEVKRLADGFRNGFHSRLAYNLKDLLVEIVLSEWFRADVLIAADPVRRVALHNAGAKRLLTPEELARKTGVVTGFQPGRYIFTVPHFGLNDNGNDLTDRYRMLYGGIDSLGITERARDITAVMAGVAKRHAAVVSCPVIMREVYLLPDAQRRLFAGIDPHVTPASEFSGTFEVTAASRSNMQTLSLQGHLRAGEKTVSLAFLNDYWHETRGDRNILLDRLTVRQGNAVVYRYELENLDHPVDCHHIEQNAFHLSGSGPGCVLAVPVTIPSDGVYQIDISAWATHAGDELPRLSVAIESDAEGSAGSATIRNKLVELHDKLLGVQVAPDSPDVEAAYRLFVDVWQHKRNSEDTEPFSPWSRGCDWQADIFFYEGILDGAVVEYEDEHGRHFVFDWDRVGDFLDGTDFSDPHHIAQTWVVVLAAMMMDDRYLYLH